MSTAAETAAAATSGSDHRLLQTTTAETTAASEDQLHNSTTITDKHAQDQSHQPSATTFNDTTAPAATIAAFTATVVVSSPQPTSIIKSEVTSQISSTVSSNEATQIFNQNLSSPSASTGTTMTTNPTSEAAPVFNPTSMPGATTETSKISSELPSTSHPISATTVLTSTGAAGSSSTPTSVSTDPPSSTVSNSSAGILVPDNPKKLPVPTFRPMPATTAAPRHVTKSPSSTETQPCSTRSLARNCLIIIAALAALATVFMVSTIVLCTKLSARKYRVKKPQQGTEMMCISALLPEPSYSYTRQRNPVRNGVRVIPGGGDSDDDLGDNLTLSSFLPENDRCV
uniref:Selectin P ligand n=2 Tax=Amphiprion ocellaris TaxID=80972 RepID=A0A3Q1C7N0_AMPOC